MTTHEADSQQAVQSKNTDKKIILRKTGWLILSLVIFIVLFILQMTHRYSTPASALKTLIRGIMETDFLILQDPHYLIRNDKTALYGEEVLRAWQEADREGQKILEQAKRWVRQKGMTYYRQLDEMDQNDIEELAYRCFLSKRLYPSVKMKNPGFPDSLIFCGLTAKALFIHQKGISALTAEEQRQIGELKKADFIAQKDSFITQTARKTNPKAALKEYQSRLRLYQRIDRKGMEEYLRFLSELENAATLAGIKPSRQELQKIRQQSLNDYLLRTGYRLALNFIQKEKEDRYGLSLYSDSIFISEEWAARYRYEMGIKALRSSSAEILRSFNYSIGKWYQIQPDVFIHETGRRRLFEFIRQQLIRESFTLTTVRYKSFETSLFHHPVAEAETNIGIFVFHQRNGEWFLTDYH